MRTDELDYDLPPELIAQRPAARREDARLLVYRRESGAIEHRRIDDLPDLLAPDDVIVVNTTRVLPARLHARRTTGGAVEILLLEPAGDGCWQALARPARRLVDGETVTVDDDLTISIERRLADGRLLVRPSLAGASLEQALDRAGELPLPPYIRARTADPGRYQTVFAREPGSAAAPTAGLHLGDELWPLLCRRFEIVEVELAIGLDTFRPIGEEELERHPIHSERYRVTPLAAAALASAAAAGRRIVCIGTTSLRVVEALAEADAPLEGRTSLYVTPGYRFRRVGALLTNFHLPRSTLLALVMAFVGVEAARRIYREAIAERYRFFSFGDASLLL